MNIANEKLNRATFAQGFTGVAEPTSPVSKGKHRKNCNFAAIITTWFTGITLSVTLAGLIWTVLQERERRVREAYSKLYDIDIGIWDTVISNPESHAAILNDPKGEFFKTLDLVACMKANCIFQMIGDMFEYYLLLKPDLTGHDWAERNNCWTDYFEMVVRNSYGFREYIKKTRLEWTGIFKSQFDHVVKSIGEGVQDTIASPVEIQALLVRNDDRKTAESKGGEEKKSHDGDSYLIEVLTLVFSVIAIVVSIWSFLAQNKSLYKFEVVKLLVDSNKELVSKSELIYYWDEYRKEKYINLINQSDESFSSESNGQRSGPSFSLRNFFSSEQKNKKSEINLKTYHMLRNFAFLKLNMFELVFDFYSRRPKNDTWSRYLDYSVEKSSFFREVVTDTERHRYYSAKFCERLDRSVIETLIKGIHRKYVSNTNWGFLSGLEGMFVRSTAPEKWEEVSELISAISANPNLADQLKEYCESLNAKVDLHSKIKNFFSCGSDGQRQKVSVPGELQILTELVVTLDDRLLRSDCMDHLIID